jgi:hypothetical protein
VLANTVTGTLVNAFLIHRLYRLYVPALSLVGITARSTFIGTSQD